MKKISASLLLIFGITSAAFSALNLTPHEMALNSDGPPTHRYFFDDGGKHLSFRIDGKMTLSGSSDAVGFQFADLKSAAMKISRSAMTPGAFEEKSLAAYRAFSRTFIGSDATEVQLVEERPQAISINGWTSHQFIYTYNLFGLSYRRSITFLNVHPLEQFVIDVAAVAADYEKTYARGYGVLNSITDTPVDQSGPT